MRGLLVAGLVCWTFLAVSTIALAVSFIMRSWDKSAWRVLLLSILSVTSTVVLLSSGYITTQVHAAETPKERVVQQSEPVEPIEPVQPPLLPVPVVPVVSSPQPQNGTVQINADGTVEIVQSAESAFWDID